MLNEINQLQRDKYDYTYMRYLNQSKLQMQKQNGGCQGLWGQANRSCCANKHRLSLKQDEKNQDLLHNNTGIFNNTVLYTYNLVSEQIIWSIIIYHKIKINKSWWWFSLSVVSNSCDSMGSRPPGSSVHGILQARKLEWAAISFSRISSKSRN